MKAISKYPAMYQYVVPNVLVDIGQLRLVRANTNSVRTRCLVYVSYTSKVSSSDFL